jgi:hypothetical protein
MVRLVLMAISRAIGLNHIAVCAAFFGLQHTHHILKGDVFEIPVMPSGVFEVVVFNSILMSIIDRYQYYHARPDFVKTVPWLRWIRRFYLDWTVPRDIKFTFRLDHAVGHYGDDEGVNSREGVKSFYNPELLMSDFGMKITDGRKSDHISVGPLSSISFLKRTFEFDPELGYHLAKLSLKSLVKTAVVRYSPRISDKDHGAQTLTTIVREAVLHGPEIHALFRDRALRAAEQGGFLDHPQFRVPTYETERDLLKAKKFSVYFNPEEVPDFAPDTFLFDDE